MIFTSIEYPLSAAIQTAQVMGRRNYWGANAQCNTQWGMLQAPNGPGANSGTGGD
ncbi:MAG: hypothetical protein IPJ79_13440 [Bacteroidetes bacterium]|nr:hypothetical protein [Bacteroidota bacterium]